MKNEDYGGRNFYPQDYASMPVTWPSYSTQSPAMECAECGKTFSSRTSLADHKAMHEGRTTCPVCQTQASTVANLRRHMKTKHGADYNNSPNNYLNVSMAQLDDNEQISNE